ncbi:MAG: radical SAM protein [Bacteroidales bacterium]|nr:radical SAM protein [Bacteroidales bacterium]
MFLWESIAFGPIHSRRLGSSLGINISPTDVKICSFDCIYCECGWTLTKEILPSRFAPADIILQAIEDKLKRCREEQTHIDSITFSGNGESTLHPQFPEIIDRLTVLRDHYYPGTAITCLSNATQLQNEAVRQALLKIENPMLKLDAGLPSLYQLINRPTIPVNLEDTIAGLRAFHGQFIMQSMFLKGEVDGIPFDNSSGENLAAWLEDVRLLRPRKVVLYSLDRETPAKKLIKIYINDLETIAEKVRALGIEAQVYE